MDFYLCTEKEFHGVCPGYLTPEDDFENLQEAGSYEWYNEPVWENIDPRKR